MTQTVEDAIEILAGVRPRIINIRIDHNEKNLIKSIGRQVSNGLAPVSYTHLTLPTILRV